MTNLAIANTILKQIKAADKWALAACGFRQPVATENGVQFRVSITSPSTKHYIKITLDPSDTYTVERIKVKRGSYEIINEAEISGVYCDQLASVVYNFCHKTPAQLAA